MTRVLRELDDLIAAGRVVPATLGGPFVPLSVLAEVEVPRALATAELLVASGKTVSAFVTYDRRQAGAVAAAGIPVAAPGRG